MNTKPKKAADKKEKSYGFRADNDVAEMLEAAIAAGATTTEMANAAIRKYGPEVLGAMAKEFRAKAEKIEKKISEGKR